MSSKYCLRNKTIHHHHHGYQPFPTVSNENEPNLGNKRGQKKTIQKNSRSSQNLNEANLNHFTDRLPYEVIIKIFSYLNEYDLARLLSVCKKFNSISNDYNLW